MLCILSWIFSKIKILSVKTWRKYVFFSNNCLVYSDRSKKHRYLENMVDCNSHMPIDYKKPQHRAGLIFNILEVTQWFVITRGQINVIQTKCLTKQCVFYKMWFEHNKKLWLCCNLGYNPTMARWQNDYWPKMKTT